ncbi:MAG: hypothetical protein A2W47_06510 [Gammaproteobacteria bacterium RIFCSPHIGHO2_12_38_15]|nr:MAG: hypothetical protein A2W47_06510 [Gammaproteobacteria bacterium RIFCSPHIGHO2_12_38_15]
MKNKLSAKIKWRCRRGMLELDLLLFPFYEKNFEQLSSSNQKLFIKFLDSPDPAIYNWFLGAETPPDEFQLIIEQLREFHHTTASS